MQQLSSNNLFNYKELKRHNLLTTNISPRVAREHQQSNRKDQIGNQHATRIQNEDLEGMVIEAASRPLKNETLPLLDGEEHLDGTHNQNMALGER